MLFQLHIPKTGGTTLFGVLSRSVSPKPYYVATSQEGLLSHTTGYELVGGHFTWDALSLFPERPKVLTVLRDPVELALSLYGFGRARAKAGVFNEKAQEAADEYLARPVEDLIADPESLFRTNFGMMTYYLSAGAGLDAALRNLEECDWVGTTETLDRDMQLLPAMFDLTPLADSERRMVTEDRPRAHELSPDAVRSLRALTETDRVLYDRAVEIAAEQQRRYA